MTMTDMLQMTLQSAWQMTQVSQNAGQTANSQKSQSGPSFQDLLNQRQSDMTRTGKEAADPQDSQDNQSVGTAEQPEQESQSGEADAAGAVIAEMMINYVMPVTEMAQQTTAGATAQVVQAVTAEPAVTAGQTAQTVQPQIQTGTAVLPQTQQEPQTAQQSQTTASDVQTDPVSVPQGNETAVQPSASRSETGEDLTQDLSQPAAPRTEDDAFQDVTVENFQTPLFQNVETTPVRVGEGETVDMTASAQKVDQSLGDLLKTAFHAGQQHLEIKLSPANLGTVTAEFTRTPEGVLHVVLHAQTQQTARLLSDHASSLGLILQESTHGDVRVEVPQPQQDQQLWQQPDQESGRQQQQQQQRRTPQQETESFLHQLRLGLVETGPEEIV